MGEEGDAQPLLSPKDVAKDKCQKCTETVKKNPAFFCLGCGYCCQCCCMCYVFILLTYCWLAGYFEGKGCVKNYTAELVPKHGRHFAIKSAGSGSGDMPAKPNIHKWGPMKNKYLHDTFKGWTHNTYGYIKAEDAPFALFEGSKVSGVFEKVPKKLRGVFWMNGNPLPEVLGTFQYARWFEEEQILISPKSPWAWAFWGEDHKTPNFLQTCGNIAGLSIRSPCVATPSQYAVNGKDIAVGYTSGVEDLWVIKVFSDPDEGYFRGMLQMNKNGDLAHRWVYTPPESIPQDYTLDEEYDWKAPYPGVRFHRGVYFMCGQLPPWRYGYKLKKIIDEKGEKVQPYYDQYLRFMANNSLIVMAEAPGW